MSARDFAERDIHLSLDGELHAENCAAFTAWLESHPEMQARSARFAADREALRQSLAPALAEAVPGRLSAVLDDRRGLAPSSATKGSIAPNLALWLMRVAAVLAIFTIGAVAGFGLGTRRAPQAGQDRVLADSAIQAHDIYAAEKLHVVEVKADQRDHLVGWLSKRVGLSLVAPDLSGEGYELLGGRLLPQGAKTAAQFMYQNDAGDRVSIYVTREQGGGDTGFRAAREGDTRALYWMDDDYGCAIAGDAPEPAMTAMADTAYRQLLATGKR